MLIRWNESMTTQAVSRYGNSTDQRFQTANRGVGPQRAGDLCLRAEVEGTEV
jgi:hypothetical protein